MTKSIRDRTLRLQNSSKMYTCWSSSKWPWNPTTWRCRRLLWSSISVSIYKINKSFVIIHHIYIKYVKDHLSYARSYKQLRRKTLEKIQSWTMFEPLASYQLSHITIGKLLLSLTNSNQVEPLSSFTPVSKLLTLSRQNKVARNQDNNMLYSTVAEIVSLTNIYYSPCCTCPRT